MPDTKITALAAISTVDPAVDPLVIVDVSDTSMAASGTTKKVTSNQILGAGGIATLSSATVTGAVTVGTTLGVTGAATFNGAVTLGDAVGDAVTATGSFTSHTGQNPSAIRAAASDYAAVAFDGATASTRISSTLTGQAIGTGDFSIWCRFKISQATAKAVFSVVEDANNYFGLTTSSGAYGLDKTIGGVASNATITGFTGAAFAGQIVDFVLVRSAGVFSVYVNGSAYTLTNTTGNISLSAAANLRVGGYFTASQVFDKRVYRSVVFNRALSASDVTELITVGVNPADQWGTQTQVIGFNPAVLNGGFETNSLNASGTWSTSVGGTSTATIDTSGSFSRTGTNAGKLTLDGSGSFASFQGSNGSTSFLAVNKRYRISIWARKGATSGSCGVQFGPIGSGAAYGNTGLSLTTSYANTVAEVVSSIDGGITLGRQASSAALSEIYIDDVEVTRIGAIVDLDFTVGTGFQATDRSTNNLHGTLFNGVEFTQPKRVAVLYATTNTNGNQQILGGTLAIPTNAIIEDIIVNSTGSATVSVGNASAGTQIVNGASVVSGRQRLTLATPFSTTGNLWVNSSSTATLQFTILYTIAS
jgi:hypothetical protein